MVSYLILASYLNVHYLSNHKPVSPKKQKKYDIVPTIEQGKIQQGTIHLRRQHVLGGEGCPHVPMVKRSQYIRIKNPLHKHFAGMPMVGG